MDVDDELEEERRKMMADRGRRRASMSMSAGDAAQMFARHSVTSAMAVADEDEAEGSDEEGSDEEGSEEGSGSDDAAEEEEDADEYEQASEEEEEDIYGDFGSGSGSDDEDEADYYDDDYDTMDKDDLVYMLRESEQRVQQAAEFGQQLMQQAELLTAENARASADREEMSTQIEEAEWRLEELETEKVHLQDIVAEQAEEMKTQLERTSISEPDDGGGAPSLSRSTSHKTLIAREHALGEEEDFQRNRAIAAERTVKELNASLAELRANEMELLDGKASEVTARVAAEKELREEKRKAATTEEEVAGKATVLAELQSAAEATKGEQEREKAQKTHIETRLGMLVREMKDLREFAADPNKAGAVIKRLDALDAQVAQATSPRAAAATAAPKRDLTVMVTKNDLVQAAGRSKFSVSTLEELETALISKLGLTCAAIAVRSWDAELGSFIHAADLSDLSDRCKVQLQEKEKVQEEARQIAQAEVAAMGVGDCAETEPEPEPEERPPSSEEDAKLIASQREELESLGTKLRASRKEVTRLHKFQVAQEKEASEKLNREFEKKEKAHRTKIIKMKGLSRQKKLIRDCFQGWYQSTAGEKLEKLKAAQAEAEAAAASMQGGSAEQKALLEAAERRAQEMGKLAAEQQARLMAERNVAMSAMTNAGRERTIRNVELKGEHDVMDEDGSPYNVFLLEVIASGGGKGMVTWEVAKRYSEFTRLRKALTNTVEVGKLKSKKTINNGGVDEKFQTRYSKGNMRSKASKAKGGEDSARIEMLAAWLAAVVEKWASTSVVREFLADDGSANIVADAQAVRSQLLSDGEKIEGSSLSAKIGSCTLVRSLTTAEGTVGCRAPSEKSTFLVCVSRSINSDSPRPVERKRRGSVERTLGSRGDDEPENTQKKFYVLSVITPPTVHHISSVPGAASPRVIEMVNKFCSQCLGHPYVHRVQDIQSTKGIFGKQKVLVLRDSVVRGSIRDLLLSETNPLRPFEQKYGGRTQADMKAGAPLKLPRLLLLAKQVLTAMCFLESIGVPSGHVHAGNVLLISDSRLVGEHENIAMTDFENGLLRLPHSRMGANTDEPDESEASAVAAFGCLVYEMATGCQWEHTMASIDACPPSIRPIVEQTLAMAASTPRAGGAAESEEPGISLESLLASEPFGSVALSELHTTAFPTADELPALREQCVALRAALADPLVAPEPAAVDPAGGPAEGVPPEGLMRQQSTFKEDEDYEGELADEVKKLLVSCCQDNTAKPPADAVERLRRVASLPTGGVLAPWLAKRLGEGLGEGDGGGSTPVVVKTLQLTQKLLPTSSAQFKRRLKAEGVEHLEAAKAYAKIDEKFGDKPARMVRGLAVKVDVALLGV